MNRNLVLLLLTSCIFAHKTPQRIAIHERQVTPSPAAAIPTTTSLTVTTTTAAPNEVNEPANINLDGQIFPPSIQIEGITAASTTDFTVNCVDCTINGDFALSAGDSSFPDQVFETPSDVQQRGNGSDFDFDDIWIAATVDSLNATFEFGVNLIASNHTNEITVPVWSQTKTQTLGVLTLSATLGLELHGWINTTNDVNFTHGFNFEVPPYSEVIVNLQNVTNSTVLGFNETKLSPIPFNSTRSDLDIDIEFSLRPSVEVAAHADVIVASGFVSLTAGVDLPRLDVEIKQVHNVNSSCDAAPLSTPPDMVYENLTLIAPSIGFDVFEIFNENVTLFGEPLDAEQPFNQGFEYGLPTACLMFDAAKKTLAPALAVKPAQVSVAAGVHVPLAAAFLGVGMLGLMALA